MQSGSHDNSNTPLTDNISEITSTNHHGLSTISSTSPDGPLDERLYSESAADDADNLSVTSAATGRGRRLNLRRMSSGQDSQESSPGSRIDAYERANAVSRRLSGGMVFQLIPSTNADGTSVMDMPNGIMFVPLFVTLLTMTRGIDTYLVAFTSRITIINEPNQPADSSTCHNPSCLEDCLRKILPWLSINSCSIRINC